MKAKELKNITATLNLDKERKIAFDLNAIAELEDKYGDLDKAVDALNKAKVKDIRFFLYAAMCSYEDLTEKEVGRIVNVENLNHVAEELVKIFNNSMPEVEEKN